MRANGTPSPEFDWGPVLRAFDGAADLETPSDLPEPTLAQPGTDEKRDVLALRARLGQVLFHPADPYDTTAMLSAIEQLHAQLLAEREVQPNGRPIDPELHTEDEYREALDELHRRNVDKKGLELASGALAARGYTVGNQAIAPCPRCRWRHRCRRWLGKAGNFCSWCGFDVEMAAIMARVIRKREEQEDRFVDGIAAPEADEPDELSEEDDE